MKKRFKALVARLQTKAREAARSGSKATGRLRKLAATAEMLARR